MTIRYLRKRKESNLNFCRTGNLNKNSKFDIKNIVDRGWNFQNAEVGFEEYLRPEFRLFLGLTIENVKSREHVCEKYPNFPKGIYPAPKKAGIFPEITSLLGQRIFTKTRKNGYKYCRLLFLIMAKVFMNRHKLGTFILKYDTEIRLPKVKFHGNSAKDIFRK